MATRKTAFLRKLYESGPLLWDIDDRAAECQRRIEALKAEIREAQRSLRKYEALAEKRAAELWTPAEIEDAKRRAAVEA